MHTLDRLILELEIKLENYRCSKGNLPTYNENIDLLLNLQKIVSKRNKNMLDLSEDISFKRQAI